MMGTSSRRKYAITCLRRASVYKIASVLLVLSFLTLLIVKVDNMIVQIATQTKTVAGHNLGHTPWHRFPPKKFDEGASQYKKAFNHIKCSYLSCVPDIIAPAYKIQYESNSSEMCPSFFRWIHHDLEPWAQAKISEPQLMEAKRFAAFRVVIVNGKLYVEHYYTCTQTRAMFTIWGLLQLLKRYPGMIPDVDLMFDCMDRPFFGKNRYRPGKGKRWPPPPLFRYCTNDWNFDIPFPDWSFWGWPETNIQPWDQEFRNIEKGSAALNWTTKVDHAFWKGNPYVASRARMGLLGCNDTKKWGAEVFIQNWAQEAKIGYKQSKLANQCRHRYKIYAEGFAWSVSLKYILSCGSLTLMISPAFEDFFTRGLIPKQNYWPVSYSNMCPSIKFAVEWGNAHPSEAEKIGNGGQDFMRRLDMAKVYDYMYHLIKEYSKLQNFKPTPPASAQLVCPESVLCYADLRSQEFLKSSTASPSSSPPCTLQPADHHIIESWIQNKTEVINGVEDMEKAFANKTTVS